MLPFPVGMMKTASSGLWTPLVLDGTGEEPYGWYDATGSTYMTLAGSNISSMTDRSGNARHLSRTGGVLSDPTYASDTAEFGDFTSTKGFNAWASSMPAAVWDFFFVGDPDNGANGRTLVTDPSGNAIIYLNGSGDWKLWDGGAERSNGLSWGGTGKRQGLIRMKATNDVELGMNGDTATTDFTLGGAIGSGLTAPYVGNGNAGNQGFGGLHEWLFLPTGTSSGTKEKIEGYLAWKWDTKLGGSTFVTALPGGHPYKSAAPTA